MGQPGNWRRPRCNNCQTPMQPATIPGDGLIGWYCVADKRFRPRYDMTLNSNPVNTDNES